MAIHEFDNTGSFTNSAADATITGTAGFTTAGSATLIIHNFSGTAATIVPQLSGVSSARIRRDSGVYDREPSGQAFSIDANETVIIDLIQSVATTNGTYRIASGETAHRTVAGPGVGHTGDRTEGTVGIYVGEVQVTNATA